MIALVRLRFLWRRWLLLLQLAILPRVKPAWLELRMGAHPEYDSSKRIYYLPPLPPPPLSPAAHLPVSSNLPTPPVSVMDGCQIWGVFGVARVTPVPINRCLSKFDTFWCRIL